MNIYRKVRRRRCKKPLVWGDWIPAKKPPTKSRRIYNKKIPRLLARRGIFFAIDGFLLQNQFWILSWLMAFQYITSAGSISVDSSVDDFSILDSEQEEMFVLHRIACLGLRAGDYRNQKVTTQ